jgi:hypothetical protein
VNLIEPEQKENINRAIRSLCDWIVDRTKNGASDNELANLPEVVRATAELIRVADN